MTPEHLLELARALPEPLLLLTSDGHILACNPPVAECFGLPADEISGRNLASLVTTSPDKVRQYLAACSRSRQMVLGALAFQAADEQTVMYRCEGAVVRPRSKTDQALIVLRLKPKESASSK
ncbi:MAG TPA: PAS domain-containing protein, partial [Blastocatellia bacterium]|nr:PAS domain-containing protein [Blastocatellia bacterium]